MPPVSEWFRGAGWRQGSIVGWDDSPTLLTRSVDLLPDLDDTRFVLIVTTQDCDLVGHTATEPFVEFIVGQEAADIQPMYQHGRNPRMLHILPHESQGLDGAGLKISIHDRLRIRKQALEKIELDVSLRLDPGDIRLLTRWIANRYTRPAFPDAFNERLEAVDRRLEKLFKSREGRVITGVFLDVPEEERLVEDYDIAVGITAKSEAWDDSDRLADVSGFEAKFSEISRWVRRSRHCRRRHQSTTGGRPYIG